MSSFLSLLSTDIIVFIIAVVACATFAFLETSITKMRIFNITELKNSTQKYYSILTLLEKNPQQVLIAVLIATNMAGITAALIAQNIVERIFKTLHFPQGLGFTIGIAFGTIIISIFGEILPKISAQTQGMPLFTSTLWLTNLLYYIFQPITKPLNYFIQRWTQSQDSNDMVSENEIRFLIDTIEQKGHIDAEKIHMLQNVFRMTNTHVKEILIPKSHMVSIDVDTPVSHVLNLFETHRFSRLPVYDKDQENITGIVYQKDLFFRLQSNKDTLIKEIVRPIIFVPDSLKVNELLKEFKQQKIHMGIVLDEYGSTIGLVTMEDALEEIVGEIIDEHDKDGSHEKIKIISKDSEWLVDATLDLDRLKEYLKIPFSVETSVTLGGFLTERLQHLPKKEEQLHYQGYCFNIEEADSKRIISVRVTASNDPEKCNKK